MSQHLLEQRIAENLGVSQAEADRILNAVMKETIEATVEYGELTLRNFGKFSITQRSARTARNPKTGEAVEVPAKNYVRFKAGKAFAYQANA